jgi:hypothetical protein
MVHRVIMLGRAGHGITALFQIFGRDGPIKNQTTSNDLKKWRRVSI